ncbi:MAG: LCP family protein [Bacillota bacterium]
MKTFLKVFFIATLCFGLMFASGIYAFNKYQVDNEEDIEVEIIEDNVVNVEEKEKKEEKTKLEKLIEDSNRINVLAFGVEGFRADTIMLVSYDPDNDLLDMISIPRDTYHNVKGYGAPGQHKINAVYGFDQNGGSKGMKAYLENFLNVPIDAYVKIDYDGVESIVDVIGGINVYVSQKMNYDDPYSDPPLHIHFEKGNHHLNGKDALKYLRWRKNNDGKNLGDINRISRQQDFLKKAIDKALGLKLPRVVKTSLNYVQTDMKAGKIINLAYKAKDFQMKDLKTYQIPGEVDTVNNLSVYIHHPGEMEKMFEKIYSRK